MLAPPPSPSLLRDRGALPPYISVHRCVHEHNMNIYEFGLMPECKQSARVCVCVRVCVRAHACIVTCTC